MTYQGIALCRSSNASGSQRGGYSSAGPAAGKRHSNAAHASGEGQGAAKSNSQRGRRGRGSGQSKGPGFAAPSAAAPGHLGGARPDSSRPGGSGASNAHRASSSQQQQPHRQPGPPGLQQQPLQHAREFHQQQLHQHGQLQQPQQQQQAGAAGPINTSALSGVMFASLGLHPLTLSGLHVSLS